MEKSKVKNEKRQSSTNATIGVGFEMRRKFVSRLEEINQKPFGRRISPRQYLEFLMGLETPEGLKSLFRASIRGKDINELYKKRFFEKFNTQSEDDYYSLVCSNKFSKFKNDNKDVLDMF